MSTKERPLSNAAAQASTNGKQAKTTYLNIDELSQQIEMLTPKENGFVEDGEGGEGEEEKRKHTASIKGMWKKAFKSLKSNDKQSWLSKKGSLIRRKDSEEKVEPAETTKEIDPVYSLLKCAADLPKVPKSQKETHLGGRGDSSGSTSKASSPSSSGVSPQSPTGAFPGPGGAAAARNSISSTTPIFPTGSASNREQMHQIVDESLGSEFRTFYKLTSPVKKSSIPNYDCSKNSSPNSKFEGTVVYDNN